MKKHTISDALTCTTLDLYAYLNELMEELANSSNYDDEYVGRLKNEIRDTKETIKTLTGIIHAQLDK